MKDSEILKAAKAKLWKGPLEGPLEGPMPMGTYKAVCSTLWAVDTLKYSSQVTSLRDGIKQSIWPHKSVIHWVAKKMGRNPAHITPQEQQNYRHAWIDHMIAECAAKGH